MGESKHKTEPKPVERPTAAIIQMRQAVQVGGAQDLDPDSLEFMRSLGALLNWMDALEKTREAPPGTVKVPETEDEAVTMSLLSMAWLKERAPHRLTESGELPVPKLDA